MKSKALATILILALFAFLVVGVALVKASPKTIIVPDDYPTIQEAVDNADEGDTVFVKKGTYQERVLKINKSIRVLGEDKDKTIINFDPPVVNYTFFYHTLQAHAIAITIDANDVKFSGFTINMPTDMDSLGGINATGDRIEIICNNLGREGHVRLNGKSANISENSIPAGLNICGDDHTIMNNLLEGGLETLGVYNRIVGNTIGDVVLSNSSFNLFLNNSLAWLYMKYCDYNFISNNTMDRMDMVTPCFNNTVSKNKITGPGLWGILIGQGSYNVFHDNLISNFIDGYGIALGGNHFIAENNVFYRNILINNDMHVGANWEILGAGNTWDNGEEGNYWDNYAGTDDDGDGIGDVPYVVEGCKWDDDAHGLVSFVFGQDNYPLMFPFDINNVDIVLPEWAGESSGPSPSPSQSTSPQEPEPISPILFIGSAITVSVIGIGLLVYFKKRKH
jgi:nitrous oxidase accessory protein